MLQDFVGRGDNFTITYYTLHLTRSSELVFRIVKIEYNFINRKAAGYERSRLLVHDD